MAVVEKRERLGAMVRNGQIQGGMDVRSVFADIKLSTMRSRPWLLPHCVFVSLSA